MLEIHDPVAGRYARYRAGVTAARERSTTRLSFEAARISIRRPDLHFHDLRHTYVSWLTQAGVAQRAVMEVLGDSTLTVSQRYSHLAAEHLREAVRAMEDRHNTVTPLSIGR